MKWSTLEDERETGKKSLQMLNSIKLDKLHFYFKCGENSKL